MTAKKTPRRGRQSSRQWTILKILQASDGTLTVAQIHQRIGDHVGERTVRRDLRALSDAGFAVVNVRGRWTADAGAASVVMPLDTSELIALALAEQLLVPLSPSLATAVSETLKKLRASAPDLQRRRFEQWKEATGQSSRRLAQISDREVIEHLIAALQKTG